jgi:alkaline phosphatase
VVSPEELKKLQRAKIEGAELTSAYSKLDEKAQQQYKIKPSVKNSIYVAIKFLIDQRTNSGWTTGGHTAVDVPVFALGSNKIMFHGQIDNTDVAKKIFTLLDKK